LDESEVTMSARYYSSPASRLEPAEILVKAAIRSWTNPTESPRGGKPRVFVTVARQPGAGAISLSHRLADRLNLIGQADWSAWDRELVERVSLEHGVDKDIIEMIPNRHHSWIEDLLQNFSASENPPDVQEIRAYKRVAMTIRALASAGHAIIVGQGGRFITDRMPGAIHIRLVAPLDHRIKWTAEREKITLHEAADRVVELDQRRRNFYSRYWVGKVIGPETFTMTLNSAELSLDELVECVVPIIHARESAEAGKYVRQETPSATAVS
jgi:cytidylate kinase